MSQLKFESDNKITWVKLKKINNFYELAFRSSMGGMIKFKHNAIQFNAHCFPHSMIGTGNLASFYLYTEYTHSMEK